MNKNINPPPGRFFFPHIFFLFLLAPTVGFCLINLGSCKNGHMPHAHQSCMQKERSMGEKNFKFISSNFFPSSNKAATWLINIYIIYSWYPPTCLSPISPFAHKLHTHARTQCSMLARTQQIVRSPTKNMSIARVWHIHCNDEWTDSSQKKIAILFIYFLLFSILASFFAANDFITGNILCNNEDNVLAIQEYEQ